VPSSDSNFCAKNWIKPRRGVAPVCLVQTNRETWALDSLG